MESDLKSKISILNNEQKKKIIYQIADIMSTLHSKNIIHNDLNCKNILVDQNNDVFLCDFGITKKVLFEMKTIGISGTDQFKPRELYQGVRGIFTDSYGFGMIIYELLEGETPFYHLNENDVITSVLNGELPLFTKSNPDMLFYEKLMMQCLSKIDVKEDDDGKIHIENCKRPNFKEILYMIENNK